MVVFASMLTTREAAERLGVTQSWVRRLIRDGRLTGTKYGRDYLIVASDLEAFAQLPREKTGRPIKK